jgi:4-cresol dehydrogenase (hydroxylating)
MDLDGFHARLRDHVGEDRVITTDEALASYRDSASGHQRTVPMVIRPADTEHVRAVVKAANDFRVPIYPVSRGRNWGLGSRLPVRDGGVVVDLADMDRIHEVNETFGYAVIEPGVTQGGLSDHLRSRNSRYFLDVTGSGTTTSVIGNTLERGVAYNTTRAETLIALDVVLPNGEILGTGFAHDHRSKVANLFPHGIGPGLRDLFLQSNLGIVTRATVALIPRPATLATFMLSVRDEEALPRVFDSMRRLHQEGSLQSIVHVGNRRRSEITILPLVHRQLAGLGLPPTREEAETIVNGQLSGPWSAIGAIMGEPGHVAAARKRVKKQLGPLGRLRILTPRLRETAKMVAGTLKLKRMQAFLLGVEPLMGLTAGVPTDAALHSTWWPAGGTEPDILDPDSSEGGIVFAAPIVPLEGAAVREALRLTESVASGFHMHPAVTLNLMSDKALEGVVSLDFRRTDPDSVARAHACIRALNEAYMENGFSPYRIDIGNMDLLADPEDPFWRTAATLKRALDPNNILAPGRYGLG